MVASGACGDSWLLAFALHDEVLAEPDASRILSKAAHSTKTPTFQVGCFRVPQDRLGDIRGSWMYLP
jgi:hypothetical protein